MEVRAANIEQLERARDGRLVTVGGEVAAALQEFDPQLHLRYSETGGYYVVYRVWETPQGEQCEKLVFTALDNDHRIVARAMLIASEKYDFIADMEAKEISAKREWEAGLREHAEAIGPQLQHAMVKGTNRDQQRIFVPHGPDLR